MTAKGFAVLVSATFLLLLAACTTPEPPASTSQPAPPVAAPRPRPPQPVGVPSKPPTAYPVKPVTTTNVKSPHRQYLDQRTGRYYYFDQASHRYYWEDGSPRY